MLVDLLIADWLVSSIVTLVRVMVVAASDIVSCSKAKVSASVIAC
jgi:hypothetical protein